MCFFEAGVVLTVADINRLAAHMEHNRDKMTMTLHGPAGLDKFYRATRHFMAASDVGVRCVQPGVSYLTILTRWATVST